MARVALNSVCANTFGRVEYIVLLNEIKIEQF